MLHLVFSETPCSRDSWFRANLRGSKSGTSLKVFDQEITVTHPHGTPNTLGPFPSDTPCQLNVLRHDRHPLCVDSAKIRVLEEADQICLCSLLKGQYRGRLKPKVGLEVLGNLSYKSLEWQLSNQKLGTLLVLPDLTERHSTGTVSMRLFHASCGWGAFTCGLGGELLPWGFASSRLACCLLRPCHCEPSPRAAVVTGASCCLMGRQ